MPSLKQVRCSDWPVGLGLALLALALYITTLAPTVLEADSGEFQFVPWLPGIAHPPGYPLYILLGWLWTHLFPLGEVAWRMNLLSAVFAAATISLTYVVARQLLDMTLPDTPLPARLISAAIAAAAFAISPTFWSQAIVAEVYALHAMLMALILYLALQLRGNARVFSFPNLNSWPAKCLTFAFAVGLTHHLTTILLLPALVLFLLWPAGPNIAAARKSPHSGEAKKSREPARTLFVHGILFISPLLLYLYLPLIAPSTPYATLALSDHQILTLYDNSLAGFLRHVTAMVFAGELQPDAVEISRVVLVWQLLQQQVGWLGLILALAGLLTLWLRQQFDLLVLTGLGSLGFLLFNLIYFIGDVFVLFIPIWLLVCLWMGLGSLGLAHWLAGSFVRRKAGPPQARPVFGEMEQRLGQKIYRMLVVGLVSACFLLAVLPMVTRNWAVVNQKNNTAARERWSEILAQPIPTGAVLLSNDRNEMMPLWYYQYVEGRRPDLLGLFPLIVPDPAYANVGLVLDQALASGRPVYLIKSMPGLSLKATLVQEDALYRAAPDPTLPPHRYEVVFSGVTSESNQSESVKLLGHDLSAERVLPGDEIAVTLYWQPEQVLSVDYTSYVHLLNSEGQGVTQNDHLPGGVFYPSSRWQIGEILRDRHTLTIPANTLPGRYRLRVGLYYQPEPGVMVGLGGGVEIGQVSVLTSE
ncbi:MAG: DUF2723 domain-containing protein [Anaerolineae bacterium]|nr:DUF2723 domain-containing protein [Anaerolineae bacterium]